ncbi:hypothetical protein [Enemella dayhoffiae]|nr:hypothetical protein [Enemella dayhoffiae]
MVLDNGDTLVAGPSHPNFGAIVTATADAQIGDEQLLDLFQAGATATRELRRLSERVSLRNGDTILFDGTPIDKVITRHIVNMFQASDPHWSHLVAFLENLAQNPGEKSRRHLYHFIDAHGLTITPAGMFVAYKGVQVDGTSVHSGPGTVDGVQMFGHLPNQIGSVLEIDRAYVDDNRQVGCSRGLHVAAPSPTPTGSAAACSPSPSTPATWCRCRPMPTTRRSGCAGTGSRRSPRWPRTPPFRSASTTTPTTRTSSRMPRTTCTATPAAWPPVAGAPIPVRENDHMAAPVNYTTTVEVHKTVGEVQALLADHGADRVGIEYRDSQPVGVSFTLRLPAGTRAFMLPVDVEAMHRLLQSKDSSGELRSGTKANRASREQAARVSWRVVKDWLPAQLTLVDSTMVTVEQVFLPYLQLDDGRTLFEVYSTSELALEPGPDGPG